MMVDCRNWLWPVFMGFFFLVVVVVVVVVGVVVEMIVTLLKFL